MSLCTISKAGFTWRQGKNYHTNFTVLNLFDCDIDRENTSSELVTSKTVLPK